MRSLAAQLLSAPHRLFFFTAALLWSAVAAWWAVVMLAPWTGWSPRWSLPPGVLHGLLMSFGFMPLFIAGFLYTAGPRWLQTPPPGRRVQLLAAWALGGGALLVLAGGHLHDAAVVVGLLGMAGGWTAVQMGFTRMCRTSRVADRWHARVIAAAGGLLALALWLGVVAVAVRHPVLLHVALRLGLWGGVAAIFVVAVHRLTPLLHAGRGPRLAHGLLGPVLLGLGLWLVSDLVPLAGTAAWPGAVHGVMAVLGVLLGGALWRAAWAPELARARRAPMLRMLHAAVVWLGLAFLLQALAHGRAASGGSAGPDLASLHALTLGFMATAMLAMTSRVAAVQQGRTVAIDRLILALYRLLQLVAALRVLAALWPAAPALLLPAAAALFAVLALGWTLRHGRWFGRRPATAGGGPARHR